MLLNSDPKANTTGNIAGGGLLAALVLIFILLSYISPTADLALMSCASLGIAVAVVRYGFRTAIIVLIVSGIISSIWPGILFSLPFLLLFGPWPLLKAVIEKRYNKIAALFLKQLCATIIIIIAGATYLFIFHIDLRSIIQVDLLAGLPNMIFWLVILLTAEVAFCLYDWALTLLITIYMRRLNGRI